MEELVRLHSLYPVLDMPEAVIREIVSGVDLDCGCLATRRLAAVGHRRLPGPLHAGHIKRASDVVGRRRRARTEAVPAVKPKQSPFRILGVKRPS